jgi:ABC-type lipoprotein release transport system permease subunit
VLLRIALRNIARGWRRSLIVLSSIGIGLVGCVVVLAWNKGFAYQMADNAVRTQLAHLAIHATGYQADPDVGRNFGDYDALAERVGRIDGAAASVRLRGEGLVRTARHSVLAMMIGVRPDAEAAVSIVPGSLVEGSFLPSGAGARRLPPIVIGTRMAEDLQVGIGQKLVLQVPGEAGLGAFRVSGVYRTASSEFDKLAVFLHLSDAQRLFDVGRRVTEVAVALDDERRMLEVQAVLRADAEGLEVLTWREREPRLAAMIGLMTELSWILYATVFVAMAFGIANTMLMAVYERLREFGVMRSLGLSRARLMALIVCESAALTMVGTGAGLAVAFAIVAWMGEAGVDLSGFSDALEGYGIGSTVYPRVGTDDVGTPLVLALATGVIAALWPALRAIRLRPAEALRGN